MTPILTTVSEMTGLSEPILNWLVSAYGLSLLGSVWAFIQMPRQIKKMREALVDQNQLLRTRIFPKITRLENYNIDEFHRNNPDDELPEILQEMRKDQYPEADRLDKELLAKKRKEFEDSLI